MKNIVLIHFLPLEYYPPATNMINYLADELDSNIKLSVFSSHNTRKRNVFNNTKVKIYRTAQSEGDKNKLIRGLKYTYFQLFVLLRLIIIRPKKILYYETLSSFPVFLYKVFIGRKSEIYIHYHEYTTPEQYANHSMTIERFFHKLEQRFLYKKAHWISQTNTDRLKMFFKDNPNVFENVLKEMPNYPPKSWTSMIPQNRKEEGNVQLKCVYIGSLSIKDTYIKEFLEWVIQLKGRVIFDIFAYNLHLDTFRFLENISSPYIKFYSKGVEYKNLPSLLSKYNIGIILYKGITKNFEFNAPNKLFEYLACGLNVWFPNKMKGIIPYIQKGEKQNVFSIDFEQLENFDYKKTLHKRNTQNDNSFICDDIYTSIRKELEK